jgi:hypothetical protein
MGATPLDEICLPGHAVSEIARADTDEWITNHSVTVKRGWWTDKLTHAGLADTVVGSNISRGDIFTLAPQADTDPDAALTLLWNALAWGSGNRNRNNTKRIASVARDPRRAGELLMRAAALSHTSPAAAYELLFPGYRGAIGQLGPAFFTKYLYFAGCGEPHHPCTILDENVARALHDTCGWSSLPVKGGWSPSAYERYSTLLRMWAEKHPKITRRDLIERWLFEEGKRLVSASRSDRETAGH